MTENKLLKLTIARVDGPVFDGEVLSVTVPGASGEMTLLPQHTALISPLQKGTISYRSVTGEETTLAIVSGTVDISHNHATILI